MKVETKELTPIWKHFERFALYEDLKDLHNIVIPKIANFEQKIINYDAEGVKNNRIISDFDQLMAQKVNK